MRLFSLDTVLDLIDEAKKELLAATEPSTEQRYAIEYTARAIRDKVDKAAREGACS